MEIVKERKGFSWDSIMSSVIPSKARTDMPVFPVRCVKFAIIPPKDSSQ